MGEEFKAYWKRRIRRWIGLMGICLGGLLRKLKYSRWLNLRRGGGAGDIVELALSKERAPWLCQRTHLSIILIEIICLL